MTFTLDTVSLPLSMKWTDEFAWGAVAAKSEYSLTGALLVQASRKLAGRPITLAAEEDSGWCPRATVLAAQSLADMPGREMTLTLPDGRTFTVIFRPGEVAVEAKPILPKAIPLADDWYVMTLRLTQING
ncbi:MAG: hypothetical protein WC091_04590 [Sulfuricellaceae bacterium]